MKTFYAWLIANVESITTVLVLIICEIIWLTRSTMNVGDTIGIALLGALIISAGKTLMGNLPSKNTVTDIINLLLIITVHALLIRLSFAGFQKGEEFFSTLYFSTIGIAMIAMMFAIMAAVFTFHNMHEVVSLRMLYRNSNVSLFSIKWKYTLNRFVTTFSNLSCLGLISIVGPLMLEKVIPELAI